MSDIKLPNILVDTDWLQQHINHPQLVLLDASSHMPGSTRNAYQEWQSQRIVGARFFDFNHEICDTTSDLPHMLPNTDTFTKAVQTLGINHDSIVVIYDSVGIFASPRAWWMLTAMGFQSCAILDGGLPEWLKQGGAVDNTEPTNTPPIGNFIAQHQPQWVKNKTDVLDAINSPHIAILDARSKERFDAKAPEPREGLIGGHIPSSISLPFNELLIDTKYKSIAELKSIFAKKIANKTQLYTSCGSGVTACIIAFAAQLAGYHDIAVYDGSWCEWGQPELQLPIHPLD